MMVHTDLTYLDPVYVVEENGRRFEYKYLIAFLDNRSRFVIETDLLFIMHF